MPRVENGVLSADWRIVAPSRPTTRRRSIVALMMLLLLLSVVPTAFARDTNLKERHLTQPLIQTAAQVGATVICPHPAHLP